MRGNATACQPERPRAGIAGVYGISPERNPVKHTLYLESDWFPVVGAFVEIRLYDKPVRTGRVDGVTSDDQILWIAADGAENRAMFERSQNYSVWISPRDWLSNGKGETQDHR